MKKILIVTGELSGFNYVKELVPLIKEDFEIYGVFLEELPKTKLIVNANKLTAFGLFESIKKLPALLRAKRKIEETIKREKIEAVVLVDFPGFNLKIAQTAKNLGAKVLYFIPPKFWAWGEKRIERFKKVVDKTFVIFPFELSFYQKHGISVKYVGNPLIDAVKPSSSKESFLKKFSLKEPLIALLPGSRTTEIKYLLKPILEATTKLKGFSFALPVASSVKKEPIEKTVKSINPLVRLIPEEERYNLLFYSQIGIIASGTASLEAAIAELPHLVLYKLNPLTYFVAKRVVKIPFVSLPNIIADKFIVPELIQEKVKPKAIIETSQGLLNNKEKFKKLLRKEVKEKLRGNAIKTLAEELKKELL